MQGLHGHAGLQGLSMPGILWLPLLFACSSLVVLIQAPAVFLRIAGNCSNRVHNAGSCCTWMHSGLTLNALNVSCRCMPHICDPADSLAVPAGPYTMLSSLTQPGSCYS